MRCIEGALEPPLEGWGYNDYFITTAVKPGVEALTLVMIIVPTSDRIGLQSLLCHGPVR